MLLPEVVIRCVTQASRVTRAFMYHFGFRVLLQLHAS